jgi:hypothetical protein
MGPDMYPPWLLLRILIMLSYFFPTAKLVPDKNLADMAFQDVKKRKQVFWLNRIRKYWVLFIAIYFEENLLLSL